MLKLRIQYQGQNGQKEDKELLDLNKKLWNLENVNNANPSWLDGVCGPADKTTKSIYGNLLYIAPETIAETPLEYKN
ncbi:unnamed protein product [Rhizophagus irregularis]|nr:unnamed protein product [Rhizophagus irregularis]